MFKMLWVKERGQKMKKNLLKIIPLLMMIFSFCCSVYAQDNSICVVIDGRQVQFDVEPQLIDGRTMLPVRAIFDELGATVGWDSEARAVNAKKDDTVITLMIDSKTMYVNGQEKELDVPAMIKDGRTLVPVRAISEAFGNQVGWDKKLQTVSVIQDTSSYTMLYADGNREKLFDNSEVSYQLTQGWYSEPLADVSKNITQIEGFIESGKYLEAMQECENLKVYNVSDETKNKISRLYNEAKSKYDAYVISTQKYSTVEVRTEILKYLNKGLKGETSAIKALTNYISSYNNSYYQSKYKDAYMEAIDISIVAYEEAYSISSEYSDLNEISSKTRSITKNLYSLKNNFKPMNASAIFKENTNLSGDILSIMKSY